MSPFSPTPEPSNANTVERRRTNRSWIETPRDIVVGFTALFVIVEFIGAFGSIPAQVALLALLTFLSLNVAIFGHRTERTAGLVMSALFVTRLFTLTFPFVGTSLFTHALVIGGCMVIIAYVTTWVLGLDLSTGRSREGFPLKRPIVSRNFTAGLTTLTGVPLGWICYTIMSPNQPTISPILDTAVIGWIIAGFALLLVAFGEELIFRRLVAAMVQHTAHSQTPWISGILYGSVFLATQNPAMVFTAFAAGTLWAASCERTGSIEPVAVAHGLCLVLMYLVFPMVIG